MKKKIAKDISFIYSDSAEKNMFYPIMEEAKKRGYSIKLSKNKFEKCEIGFYCQHVNFPEYSKLSVIMLHDIIQQYSNWPDIWYREPWNKYDIGILPSMQWVKNWQKCSQWYYTRPKRGVYQIGWPKADTMNKSKNEQKNISYPHINPKKRTVLYAPAWENDGKQDDFVKAMQKLDVNILIKQGDFDPSIYPEIYKSIEEMYRIHKDIKNVTIMPTDTNIFDAIAISDILVSEESSTMVEALMFGIPAISVSDWLIPDQTPSRLPKCDYDFVITTERENLSDCVANVLDNYIEYKNNAIKFRDMNFSNIGNTSKMIMDIVDDVVNEKSIRYPCVIPNKNKPVGLKKDFFRKYIQLNLYLQNNICKRSRILNCVYNVLKSFKHAFD